MPTYDFRCVSSYEHEFETFLTFSEYDGCQKANVWPVCPTCQCPAKLAIPESPPDISFAKSDNLGKIAENNSKKFGKFGVEDRTLAEEKRRKPKPKPQLTKKHWYGQLDKPKAKEIFGETDKKKQKEKINKYVIHGE